MSRCPSCNKFASYDEPQIEVNSVDVSSEGDGGTVTSSVRIVLQSSCCGDEIKDAEVEAEQTFEHTCEDGKIAEDWEEGDDQFEIESEGDPEGTDRYADKDRNGKPIKSIRYAKHYYGFTLESDIKCKKCGEVFQVITEGEEQASGFNELN